MAKNDEVKTALREHGAKHSLFYAAQMGMVELVEDLIKEGADVNEKNHDGKIPLDWAECCDDEVKKEEVKAVFAKHSLLLAAQVGTAELAP